jgi:hypothetical protein
MTYHLHAQFSTTGKVAGKSKRLKKPKRRDELRLYIRF